jgi:hypothetical protein
MTVQYTHKRLVAAACCIAFSSLALCQLTAAVLQQLAV